MSRSVWKGPYIDASILRKMDKMEKQEYNTKVFKAARRAVILPQVVGLHLSTYNGYKWISFLVTEDMVGHKIGEFSSTRKVVKHKNK